MNPLISGDKTSPWLSHVKAGWNPVALKYMVSINARTLSENTNPEYEIRYIDISSVNSHGVIEKVETMPYGKAPSRARRVVRHGDTIVSTVRTYLQAVAAIPEQDDNLIASTGFAAISPESDVLVPRFLSYWLCSSYFVDEVCARSVGVSYPATNASEIGAIPAPVPPLPTQQAIADYLDGKTAVIDALIEKKRRLLALLAEERAALINQAVTKGLDPSVPMKDSGIPWIGEVPARWEVKRLKFLVTEACAGPYGSSLTKGMYTTTGYRVYGQQQVIADDLTLGDYYISAVKFESMRRYEVQPGDLLISVMGTVGKVAVVPEGAEPGIINPRLVRYRPDFQQVYVRFLQLAISSETCQAPLKEAAKGSTMDGLNMMILGDLCVPLPPILEQVQINDAIRQLASELNETITRIQEQVQGLIEYRQALITAAVTGQLDIEPLR